VYLFAEAELDCFKNKKPCGSLNRHGNNLSKIWLLKLCSRVTTASTTHMYVGKVIALKHHARLLQPHPLEEQFNFFESVPKESLHSSPR